MSPPPIESAALSRALLRSEAYRIGGILSAFAFLGLLLVARSLATDDPAQQDMLVRILALMAAAAAYEAGMLFVVRRAARAERTPPAWLWLLNVIIECSIPTIGLLILTHTDGMGPFRALAAPAVLFYTFFIILSTLRLRPALSIVSGIVCAAGHLGVLAYAVRVHPGTGFDDSIFPLPIYLTYPAFLLIAGVLAAFIAHQVRRHVVAAVTEAESRQRMVRDLDLARSIQQGLLPDTAPTIAGFEIAGWNQPADQTGGDYYDWQQLADGRVAVTLADVTGHGIGPALVTAVCRAYARASMPSGDALGPLMDQINTLLLEDLPDDRFVTFVAALLVPDEDGVEMLSAGHGPILHYSAATGKIDDFGAHGVPLGVIPDVEYGRSQLIEMKAGDVLVLITDGFFEWAREDGKQFGTKRLQDSLRASADREPAEIIEHFYQDTRRFVGTTPQQDDLTAVIIKRK